MIRRLKRHIVDPQTGQPFFKEREVTPIGITADPDKHAAFMDLQRSLLDLIAPELRRAFRARRYNDVLSFIALLKRSVSTVAACQGTLGVVAARFQRLVSAEARDAGEPPAAAGHSAGLPAQAGALRHDVGRGGGRAADAPGRGPGPTPGRDAARGALRLPPAQAGRGRGGCAGRPGGAGRRGAELAIPSSNGWSPRWRPSASDEPAANILVYTEYVDSQQAAAQALREAGVGEVLTMSGEDDAKARGKITDRFRAQSNLVLVSTDTAAEGLNLHERCHHLIHLELPFNPNRLEQRNGRIDRYGQDETPIVRYFYLRGTFEERILMRLIAKYERQRARLTFVPNTLGMTADDAGSARLLRGLMDEDARLFQDEETHFAPGGRRSGRRSRPGHPRPAGGD